MEVPMILRPLGEDIFCFGKKFLVFNMVSRNLKIKYRRSFLGVFWTLLSPLSMAIVYYFVFKVILNVQIPHYLVFLLSGALPWSFFSQSVLEGMESLLVSHGLITKVPIPLQVFPYVCTLTNLVTLFFSLPIMVGAALLTGVPLSGSLLMLIPYLFSLFLLTYGFSLILSMAYVYFRDLRHLMGIFMQVWFYGTPVLYSEAMIPEKYHWVVYANPVGVIFSDIHTILADGAYPPLAHTMTAMGWVLVVLLLGALTQKYRLRDIVESI